MPRASRCHPRRSAAMLSYISGRRQLTSQVIECIAVRANQKGGAWWIRKHATADMTWDQRRHCKKCGGRCMEPSNEQREGLHVSIGVRSQAKSSGSLRIYNDRASRNADPELTANFEPQLTSICQDVSAGGYKEEAGKTKKRNSGILTRTMPRRYAARGHKSLQAVHAIRPSWG
jgi:hypothetical protein